MIKFIQTADWHASLKVSYGRLRFKVISNAVDDMCKVAKKENVNFITLLGDIFDNVNPSEEEREFVSDCIYRLSKAAKVYVIAGNHDSNEMFSAMGSMEIMNKAGGKGNVEFILKPTIKKIKGKRFYFLPYRGDILSKVLSARKKRVDVLFSHFSVINGRLSSSNFKLKNGINPKLFDRFQYVGLGDLHCPQKYYSGSLGRINFGERNDEKGYLLVKIGKEKCSSSFKSTNDIDFIQFNLTDGQLINEKNGKSIGQVRSLENCVIKLKYNPIDRDNVRVFKNRILDMGAEEVKLEIVRKSNSAKIDGSKRLDYKAPFINTFKDYVDQEKSLLKRPKRKKKLIKFVNKVVNDSGIF